MAAAGLGVKTRSGLRRGRRLHLAGVAVEEVVVVSSNKVKDRVNKAQRVAWSPSSSMWITSESVRLSPRVSCLPMREG